MAKNLSILAKHKKLVNIDKRKFMADGESGTLSKADMKDQNVYNKSEIPWGDRLAKRHRLMIV